MNALGSISQVYMLVLLILMVLGTGLAIWRFISFLMERKAPKEETGKKKTENMLKSPVVLAEAATKQNGGSIMKRNGWLNLAAFSLAGLLVSVVFMGFMYTRNNPANGNNNNHQTAQAQSGMYYNMPMGNNGNVSYQQQMDRMQQQMTQMQQQSGMNGMMDDMMAKMDSMMNMMSSSSNMNGMNNGMNNMSGSNNMQGTMNNMMSKMDSMMGMVNGSSNMNGMNNIPGSSSMNGMNNMGSSYNMGNMMDDMMNMMDDMMGMMNNMQQQNNNSSMSMPMM